MSKPAKIKPAKPIGLSWPWTTLARQLTTVLAKLELDECLCLSVKDSDRYVRFSLEWDFGMRVETTSNSYLGEREQLDEQQIASLIAAGWNAPTWIPPETLPDDFMSGDWLNDDDNDNCSNFFVDLNLPAEIDRVADLAVRTVAEILRVPSPERLEYYAYDENAEPIEFPELGLHLAEPVDDGDKVELTQLLLETIRDAAGAGDIEYDEDGDIGVRYKSALSFVRLSQDGLIVSFFSQLLTDVRENPVIFSRLNDINCNETMLRVFYSEGVDSEGVVYAATDIPSLPFVGIHVAEAFGHFCGAADRLGIQLKAEFGGETAFEDNTQSGFSTIYSNLQSS